MFICNVNIPFGCAGRNRKQDTPQAKLVRAQRDACFKSFSNLWMEKGKSWSQFPDTTKQAVATMMSKSPACWPWSVTEHKIQTKITNFRRGNKVKQECESVDLASGSGEEEKVPKKQKEKRRMSTPGKTFSAKKKKKVVALTSRFPKKTIT